MNISDQSSRTEKVVIMTLKKWINLTLISLLLVAILGVLLRYKITFSLPIINQKYLQHSHSHFAMTGWITQMIMILLACRVSSVFSDQHFKKYNFVLFFNLASAYGMLVSFLFQGYGPVSIFFSTCSILAMYVFGVQLWRDMSKSTVKLPSFPWFKASIIFAFLSTLGIMFLVYLMVSRNRDINIQQATTYYFLHFQYNGFFFFSCFGLFLNILDNKGINLTGTNKFFWFYSIATAISYFLSTLWMHFPLGIYLIVAASGIVLLMGWVWFVNQLRGHLPALRPSLSVPVSWLLLLSAIAYTIKVILQAGSAIPSLNNMAFGYRPIVIGYLHLVFLAVITIFILGYLLYARYINYNRLLWYGMIVFIIGIIANELALMLQGLAAMSYKVLPFINESLFIITVVMLTGTIMVNLGIYKKSSKHKD